MDILETQISVQSIVQFVNSLFAHWYGWAIAGFLFWLIGGAIFRNWYANWHVQYRKTNPPQVTEYVSDGKGGHCYVSRPSGAEGVTDGDRTWILIARMLFPVSLVLIVVCFILEFVFCTLIGGFFANNSDKIRKITESQK